MNIDQQEVQKFSELAEKWWDKSGDFKPLHIINPLRASYIASKVDLVGKKVLDVGCGGGILAEALNDAGAIVTGIDAAGPGIEIAKLHAQENNNLYSIKSPQPKTCSKALKKNLISLLV